MRVKNCQVRVKALAEATTTDDQGTETPEGQFEAIVATYDLDSYGDKIVPGAFKDTLAAWKAKGDPIPVLWSHASYDLDSHIGYVLEAEEREGEGLWVKGQLDLDEPKAAKVYRLMKGRRITQFSFAYDVIEGAWIEEKGEDPYYELRKLDLYEVGPCLVGVNQATELLGVKAADGRDLTFAVHGKTTPAEADAIRVAVEAALCAKGYQPTGKAGRVLSAKNEETLTSALDKISSGAKDIKSVLALLAKDEDEDDGKAADSPDSKTNTENEAKPDRSAADEEPAGAKSDAPAGPRPASIRLLADLAAFAAEADELT